MISLPTEWVETTLDNIADWGSGGTPSRKNEDYYGGDIPWFKTGDLGEKVIKKPSEFITELGLKNSSAKLFPKGAVAIAMYGATIGKTSILGIDATTNQACAVGNPKHNIATSEFLYYLLLNEKDNFIAKGKGGAQPNISQALIKEHVVYFPPFAEQKEIVGRLDKFLARVEATKARLACIQVIIQRFRKSLLAAAVNGELSKDIHLNIDKFSDKYSSDWRWPDIPLSWSVRLYPDVVDSRLGKMLDKVKNIGSPINYLGNINVRWFNFATENLQRILVSETERKDLLVKKGDVLICEGGEPGRCAIWNKNEEITFQKALHRARTKGDIIPEWLVYNLKNDADNLTLAQLFTGTTIKHLTGKALAKYPIRVPPIEEQRLIVCRVERLFAYADTIEQQAKAAKERVDKLTQAILAKAFRGELTADWRAANPDLISGNNSAAALLARIQAERAAVKPRKRASKPAINPTLSGVTQ
ncbi:restriction endonuclease subunit S [Aeromonas sp. 3925]|uniref:restriction endonuclease subunit S n=1 Tax=Aeromonas genomosp. paramedia TaxID=3086176 RepID=UPI001FFD64E5|nr:restriction endonuclease subunit S [Aeromonas genomosp. paramedia]MCK2085953.1 restriction endonuclease subunit S [Aeromonas genomosp. paramedia]